MFAAAPAEMRMENAAAVSAAGTPAATTGGTLQERMLLRLNPALADPAPVHDTSALLTQTLFGQRAALTPDAIAASLLVTGTSPHGGEKDSLTPLEAAQLPQFLMLQQLIKPISDAASGAVVQHWLAAGLAGSFTTAAPEDEGAANAVAANAAPTPAASRKTASNNATGSAPAGNVPASGPQTAALDALRKELDTLKVQVDSQSKLIAELQPTPPEGGKPVAPKRRKR
jgi:hypothetical protein